MAKKFKDFIAHEPVFHKTSIGRNPSKAKMNKSLDAVSKNTVAKGGMMLNLFGLMGGPAHWCWHGVNT